MKFILLLLLLTIGSSTAIFAQGDKKPKPYKTAVSSGKDDDCMLHEVFDKPLVINSHQRNKSTVTHTTNDYIQFNQNGVYKESIGGKVNSGTWTYDTVKKVLSVDCGTKKDWVLTSAPNGQFSISNSNETLLIKKK